jgi:hypothetical protein
LYRDSRTVHALARQVRSMPYSRTWSPCSILVCAPRVNTSPFVPSRLWGRTGEMPRHIRVSRQGAWDPRQGPAQCESRIQPVICALWTQGVRTQEGFEPPTFWLPAKPASTVGWALGRAAQRGAECSTYPLRPCTPTFRAGSMSCAWRLMIPPDRWNPRRVDCVKVVDVSAPAHGGRYDDLAIVGEDGGTATYPPVEISGVTSTSTASGVIAFTLAAFPSGRRSSKTCTCLVGTVTITLHTSDDLSLMGHYGRPSR